MGVSAVFQGCFKDFTRKLKGCHKGVTRVLQGCYKGVTRVVQGCFNGVSYKSDTRVLQVYFKCVPRLL